MPAGCADRLPQLARRLVRTVLGTRATEPRPLASGAWSQAFEMTVDGSQVVLRIGSHATEFAKDEIAAGFARPGLPVPRVLIRGVFDGWHYAITTRAYGIGVDDLSAVDVRSALPSLLTTVEAIGRVDLTGTTGYGIWTPAGTAPYDSWSEALLAIGTETVRVPGWRGTLADTAIGLGPIDIGLAAIAALGSYLPDERRMIHGDLLSRNVLTAENAVTAVLDLGNAMYGDSLYDFAWLIYWWRWNPQWRSVDIRAELSIHWQAAGLTPSYLYERLHAYLIHIGLDAIAYCTFRGRWDEVRSNVDTVVALASSAPGEFTILDRIG